MPQLTKNDPVANLDLSAEELVLLTSGLSCLLGELTRTELKTLGKPIEKLYKRFLDVAITIDNDEAHEKMIKDRLEGD